MKSATILGLGLAVALGMGTMALAKDADTGAGTGTTHTGHEDHLMGKVVSVSGTSITIETGKGDKAKQVTVETDDKTKVKVNKKDGKLSDIKEGMKIHVEPATGVAKSVSAWDADKPKDSSGTEKPHTHH